MQWIQWIKRAMEGYSLNEFARMAGISAGNLSRILRGQRPSPDVLKKIAQASGGNVSYEQLMCAADYIREKQKKSSIPIYGTISAGLPIEAYEDIMGYVDLDYSYPGDQGEYIALKISGDSMDAVNIPDGAIVVIRLQPELTDGQIGAVMINGEATVKRVYVKDGSIVLMPCSHNPKHQPQIYKLPDEVKIIGKVVKAIVEIR